MRRHLSTLILAASLSACAHRPAVSTEELPLKRVVVYRNGVGYFERGGEVDSDRLRFRVRPDHVGDFLATLAVVERGGSSVRAASFPLRLEEAQTPAPPPTDGSAPPLAKDRMETVVLELDGKDHDIAVGYIAEQPVWKPSYRLVFGKDGAALQAWGIVQNLSGEDWKDVYLSLVAGAPIAFQSTLQTAVTPQRPVVNDSGEMIASVPTSQVTLAQARPRPAPMAPPTPPPAAAAGSAAPMAKKSRAMPKPSARYDEAEMAAPIPEMDFADSYAPEAAREISMPRNVALLASTQPTAGATRYDLPAPVTVPNDSATMVLYLAQEIPGEAVYMFAPDPGVPDSSRNPFRVARFTNATRGLLERGPVAFFESGSFLGQGVLEPLSPAATATVPFALERGISVEAEHKSEQRSSRLAKIEANNLTVERDQVQKTIYRLRSGTDKDAKVLVKHPRSQGMRLYNPPAGTEDNVGTGQALVPVVVPANASAELKVEEIRPFQTAVDWLSEQANEAVREYLADKRANPKIADPLRSAWAIRAELVKAIEERTKRTAEREILERGAGEARANLEAIERNRGNVSDLLKQLSARVMDLDKKIAAANKRLVELELQINEQQIRFNEMLREIKLLEALPAA